MENSTILDGNDKAQAPVMSVQDWVIMYLIGMVPVVGFIMLFVWAFSSTENPNKSNAAKAILIVSLVVTVLIAVLFGSAIGGMLSMFGGSDY